VINPYLPGEDEYDAYERMANSKLCYCVIEATNHVSLSDFVSTALSYGLHLAGGPVFVEGMWHQGVRADSTDDMTRWMIDSRLSR
jgi:hypothetical protein